MRINFIPLLTSILAIGLAACDTETTIEVPPEQVSASDESASGEPDSAVVARNMIALDGEGLRLVDPETGSTRLLAFGTDRTETERVIAAQFGTMGERSSSGECGAGPMDFSNFGNFSANFQDDRFVGWFLRGGDENKALTTMSGIGIGTTRSEMAESVTFEIREDSTIGTEFYTGGDSPGGFSGLLDSDAPDAKVTDLWAGTNCIFR